MAASRFLPFRFCTKNINLTGAKYSNLLTNRAFHQALIGGSVTFPQGQRRSIATSNISSSKAKYGGRFMVTMLPGDGIGPEMMNYIKEMFRCGGVPVDFEEVNLDSNKEDQHAVNEAIVSIQRNGVALKGNIETRENVRNFISRNVELRLRLELFANIIHCQSQSGIRTRHKDIDIVLIRQNTEGEYSCLEHESAHGVVESLKIVTKVKSDEIARYAFDFAKKHNRKKVTAVHKANIMKLSDGLFLDCCREMAKEYPEIAFDHIIIDNCSMQLVSNPHQFDVLLLPNLYGNILTNLACGIAGGPGIISGGNYGHTYAVFETGTRNTGKSIAGKNIANPIAMFNAAGDLLAHLGLDKYATVVRNAIQKTINVDLLHTPDLGGQSTTSEVAQNIIKEVQANTGL